MTIQWVMLWPWNITTVFFMRLPLSPIFSFPGIGMFYNTYITKAHKCNLDLALRMVFFFLFNWTAMDPFVNLSSNNMISDKKGCFIYKHRLTTSSPIAWKLQYIRVLHGCVLKLPPYFLHNRNQSQCHELEKLAWLMNKLEVRGKM